MDVKDVISVAFNSQTLFLVALFAGLLVLERFIPLNPKGLQNRNRFWINVLLLLGNGALYAVIIVVLEFKFCTWVFSQGWGLLAILGMGGGMAGFMMAFMLMDLGGYWAHRFNHSSPFLWGFHQLHHSDTVVDVTTGFRTHTIQMLCNACFECVAILIIGTPPNALIAYLFFKFVCFQFHHSNIALPCRFERFLQRIIVTPRSHFLHHLNHESYKHSNFSNIFSFWDLMFNTAQNGFRPLQIATKVGSD